MAPDKRTFFKYSEESLNEALRAIRENNTSIREASKLFGVPRATLQDRIKGRVREGPRQMGRDPVLTRDEEKKIVKWLTDLCRCGFPQRKSDLLDTVEKIVTDDKRPTPFTNNRPGEKWYHCFLRRHPELSLREPEGLTKGRAVVTEQYIRKWFSDLEVYLKETNNLDIMSDPDRILNGDESGFNLCPKTGKVLGPKGARNILEIKRGNDKENITILLVFTASGKIAIPCVVFKYIRIPKAILNSSDPTWHLTKSDSGWMNSQVFFEYVTTKLYPWLQSQNIKFPVIFFVDGHKSHLTMEISHFCEEHKIVLYSLPPNTTHLMQPADVGVFKALKCEWKKTVHQWLRQPENIHSTVTKTTFCPLLKTIIEKPSLPQNIISGFKKCGIFPFTPDAVDYTKCVQNYLESVTNNSDENPISDEEIGIAQKVLTHFENRLKDENFTCIQGLVHKLDSFKSTPNVGQMPKDNMVKSYEVIENVDNGHFVQQNSNKISENVNKFSDWLIMEDIPIIFVNDDIDIKDQEGLNDEDYLTDGQEPQEVKEPLEIVEEHNECDQEKSQDESTSVNRSTNELDKIIEKWPIISENGSQESVKIVAEEIHTQKKKRDNSSKISEKESKEGIKIVTEEIDTQEKNLNSSKIVSEKESEERIKIVTEEINRQKDKVNNNSRISEKESEGTIKIDTEDMDTQELKSLKNQDGCEKPKIKVLQDIKLKTNVMKYLVYPTPITSKQRKNVEPQPAAISSPKYREYLEQKAAKKSIDKKKQNKENKMKKKNKTKEHCWGCKEELDSDVDEGEAEHVGCDNCPRWYHLKCTGLSDRSIMELKDEYFKCDSCL